MTFNFVHQPIFPISSIFMCRNKRRKRRSLLKKGCEGKLILIVGLARIKRKYKNASHWKLYKFSILLSPSLNLLNWKKAGIKLKKGKLIFKRLWQRVWLRKGEILRYIKRLWRRRSFESFVRWERWICNYFFIEFWDFLSIKWMKFKKNFLKFT